ncbi:DUF2079 domain-containing protein [Candidatus Roizmanbacteria bacterium]|nr:DUF2079 domain-containing protein [Candidatus Roizmanbacteria bacterium]
MKYSLSKRIDNLLVILCLTFIGSIYAYISVTSHNHFQTFGWDLGFFDQIIWKASRGDLVAYSTIAKENLLADHFQVVLYLLAPLYYVWNDARVILIAQAFLVVFAAYPLFILAKTVSKNIIFSLAVVISYLLFLGTQWTILNEFHQMAFAPLFLILIFYALHFKKTWSYWIGILGLLITKEELALLVSSIGVVVWWAYKYKNRGIFTILLGIFSFFFLIYFLMPLLSVNGTYSHYDFGEAGFTPLDVIKKSITNPIFFAKSLVYPTIKIETLFYSLFPFGFLPLLSPLHLIPIAENLVTRFIYAGPQFTKWANVNHHAAPLGILLSVSTLYSSLIVAKFLSARKKIKTTITLALIGLYILLASMVQDILLHGPIHSIFKPSLYQDASWMENTRAIIKHIPPNQPVAAQNNLVPHLSARDKIYILPEIVDAEYLVVDFHDSPNAYSPLTLAQMKELVADLISTKQFTIDYQKGDAIVLKRNKSIVQ